MHMLFQRPAAVFRGGQHHAHTKTDQARGVSPARQDAMPWVRAWLLNPDTFHC